MVTAVDSSVLLDVIMDDPQWADASEAALRRASQEGGLVICECVLAEISPTLGNAAIEEFLDDWNIRFVPSSLASATLASATLAGEFSGTQLARGGKGGRVVPDFLIGAPAQLHAERLLARDRGHLRDYFKKLTVWQPVAL